MDNNNKISLTTDRVEELWSELSQAWPAVKNNPEIAEKIEKLWDILKTSGNDHLAISSEIQNLLDNSNTSTALISSNPFTTTKQTDEDLDSLLAEILGENYQNETIHSVTQPEQNQSISASASTTSGTEELDKLVASILGEDWINEDSTTTSASLSQSTQIPENANGTEDSSLIFKADHNIDSLVSSIIHDEKSNPATTNLPTNNVDDDQDIDELLNKIITEDNSKNTLTNDNLIYETGFSSTLSSLSSDESITEDTKADENIDQLINEILNEETDFSSTISDLSSNESTPIVNKADENIDHLINEILNEETDFSNTISDLSSNESTPIVNKADENIDQLINEILNEETDFSNTTSDLTSEEAIPADTKSDENIDDLINEILETKTDTDHVEDAEINIEEIVITDNVDNTFQKQKSSNKLIETEASSYKQPEKESSNTFLIILLILLILSAVAAWWFFFNKDEITQKYEPIKKQATETTPRNKEDSLVNLETAEEKYTAPIIKEDTDKTTAQTEPYPDNNETGYTGLIENNDNDITIILNTPETAIDTKTDSDIFKENEVVTTEEVKPLADDSTIENIPETATTTETLSDNELIIEKAKKEKPVKKVTKRRVIIHKIVKGDTLWAIAKRYVNNPYRYRELAKLSKIKNPNRIYPGNKVRIIIYTK